MDFLIFTTPHRGFAGLRACSAFRCGASGRALGHVCCVRVLPNCFLAPVKSLNVHVLLRSSSGCLTGGLRLAPESATLSKMIEGIEMRRAGNSRASPGRLLDVKWFKKKPRSCRPVQFCNPPYGFTPSSRREIKCDRQFVPKRRTHLQNPRPLCRPGKDRASPQFARSH